MAGRQLQRGARPAWGRRSRGAGAARAVVAIAAAFTLAIGAPDAFAARSARASATPTPSIDLAVTSIVTPAPVTLGRDVTWTMAVANNGPDAATGVTLGDPLPAGSSFVAAFSSQGTCSGGLVVDCELGTVPDGATVTITLVTTARVAGTLTNTAMVVGNESETNPVDNSTTATDEATAALVPPPVSRPEAVHCTAVDVAPKQRSAGHGSAAVLLIVDHGERTPRVRVRTVGKLIEIVVGRANADQAILPTSAPPSGLTVGFLRKPYEWVVRYAGSHQVVVSARASVGIGVVRVRVHPSKTGAVTLVPLSNRACSELRAGA